MKINFVLHALCLIRISEGFLPYPFVANQLLEDVLDSFENGLTYSLDDTIPGDDCYRECKPNDVRVCRFSFMMKYFQVLGG